jgi:hypothetical protein
MSDKFEIVFGEKTIECNVFQACFVSGAIHRILSADNTIRCFEIFDFDCSDDIFEQISKFIKSGCLEINESNCAKLQCVFEILDNEEVICRLIEFQECKEDFTISNCIARIKLKRGNMRSFENELEFIASNFHQFDLSELEKLKEFDVDILEEILSSQNLLLKDEDSLVEFISSLGEEFTVLYDYVVFRFLTSKGITQFLSSFSIEGINSCLWNSISSRLSCEICDWDLDDKRFIGYNSECSSKRKTSAHQRKLPYIQGGGWNGILAHLSKEFGGDIHGKGIVNITSSGDHVNSCWQVADHKWNDYWCSENVENSWICCDFKDKSVLLRHYTLKSNYHGYHCFVQWQIEGSNDENTWKSLDSRETKDLWGKSMTKTYKCSKANSNEFFRFIRMRQTGKDSSLQNFFMLSNIEFFGWLKFGG